MHISLIGMSGAGKSKWSIKLSEAGFRRYCCDDLIAMKLSHKLTKEDGMMIGLGEWMGFPFESQYKEREEAYLKAEKEVLSEILDFLENNTSYSDKNIVIDTTGSVIHTGKKILRRLRQFTRIIHLVTPLKEQASMLESYIENMRPVLWMNMFSKISGEKNEEALFRCYSNLLQYRENLYTQYADVLIGFYIRNQDGFGVINFLNEIIGMNDIADKSIRSVIKLKG